MSLNVSSPPAAEAPTRVRYGVLGFVCSLSMITYLDRVCFGAAGPAMVKALGKGRLTERTLNRITTAVSVVILSMIALLLLGPYLIF